jgi:hypothetical protein
MLRSPLLVIVSHASGSLLCNTGEEQGVYPPSPKIPMGKINLISTHIEILKSAIKLPVKQLSSREAVGRGNLSVKQ